MTSIPTAATAADSAPDRLTGLLRDVTRMLRARIDHQLEPMGLSHAQWRPLLMLHKNGGPLSQTELARLLEIEAPSLVRLLDRLAGKQLIERRNTAGDRRVRQVVLTASAEALVEQFMPIVLRVRDEAFAAVAPSELEACCSTLARIGEHLRREI